MAKSRKKVVLTEEQKKAKALKAKETRERNKQIKDKTLEAKSEKYTEFEAKLSKAKAVDTKEVESKKVESKAVVTLEATKGDTITEEDLLNADTKDTNKKNVEKVEKVEKVENVEKGLGDKNIEVYITNAVTNQAKRSLESKSFVIGAESMRTFIQESCNQCRYGDVDRAYKFAISVIKKVSKKLIVK